jgi:predicted nucleic acid-binding protein
MFTGERILIDTIILFYATDEENDFHAVAQRQLEELLATNDLVVNGQILREYANAVLRATKMRKRDWQQALSLVGKNLPLFQSRFTVLYDDSQVIQIWQSLLSLLPYGKPVYDLNIVATMRRHGLRHLFTHNVGDFAAFPDLVLIPLELPR